MKLKSEQRNGKILILLYYAIVIFNPDVICIIAWDAASFSTNIIIYYMNKINEIIIIEPKSQEV